MSMCLKFTGVFVWKQCWPNKANLQIVRISIDFGFDLVLYNPTYLPNFPSCPLQRGQRPHYATRQYLQLAQRS